jgi:hypothetical protein
MQVKLKAIIWTNKLHSRKIGLQSVVFFSQNRKDQELQRLVVQCTIRLQC